MRMQGKKQIGKVNLDDTFYAGKDLYSDGEIEDELLEACQNGTEKELLYSSNNWAVLYHLSDIRENLLEWYPFTKDDVVLEIGAGCGAITGILSKKAGHVTCIELSKKRSLINAYRHKDCNNIEIIIGNFQDIEPHVEQFDYVTLIGVLEYAGQYIGGERPYLEMLTVAKKHLKPDGKVIVAVENKMGLKYWNGAPEDHTGKLYSGLNDYVDESGVRTFSRPELESLLREAGWSSFKFYYPMPDYKLPEVIYSSERMPQPGEVRNYKEDYSAARIYNFYDATIWDQLCSDHMVPYFANSFLIECGSSISNVIYAKYSRMRKAKFQISTILTDSRGERLVKKKH